MKLKYKDFANTYSGLYKTARFYPEVLRLKKNNLNFKKAQKLLMNRVSNSTLYSWWLNKSTPLPFKDFKSIKNEFSHQDIENLATIIGHILGDGGISKKKFLHYCNTELFLIDEFQKAMRNVFNAKAKVRKEESGIMRLCYGRKFSRVLITLFGNFSGEEDKKITPQIDKMPIWWKVKLLQALYNDDGSVPKTETYVSLKQKDKNMILWTQKTLREMDINSGLTKDGSNWLLRIAGYRNLLKFKEKINFSKEYRKQIQLDKIIEKIKFPHWETKNKILKLIKNGISKRKEIAKKLKMNEYVIYGHLHGWKRLYRKSTLGLVDLGIVKIKKIRKINLYYV